MATKLPPKYKCDKCSMPALKHIQFGLLIAEALASGKPISDIPYDLEWRNVCRIHRVEACTTFVYYDEYDIP